MDCPCGSKLDYADCCGRFIDAGQIAQTAEALMRSRYTAYTKSDFNYLLTTWHSSTRPESLDEKQSQQWIGLKILRTEAGQADDSNGVVEFIARYKVNGRAFRLHETSRFVKEDGCWFYVEGIIQPVSAGINLEKRCLK